MKRAYEYFLNYAQTYTRSDEFSDSVPSTRRQFDLAAKLERELRELGAKDVSVSDGCVVYCHVPATPGLEEKTPIGFLAHMDTADFEAQNVKPRLIENYDGGDVSLGNGRVLSVRQFPHLPGLKGKTLIVTDGSTLLGADDKAGIAEIMVMTAKLLDGSLPHGPVSIAFTPDEEVGRGMETFDPKRFGAKLAYTVDGGELNALEYENFNACAAKLVLHGFNVHPGSAKDTMRNASLLAMEANALLPAGETPTHTEGYEGFFHLLRVSGDVETAELEYIVRDHDAAHFEVRQQQLRHVEKLMNERYGAGTAELTIRQQYRNMAEVVEPYPEVLDYARDAMRELGLEPVTPPIRGGTDGSALSYMGVPCPNLGTGGWAFHGPYEHVAVEDMDTAAELLCGIVRRFAEN